MNYATMSHSKINTEFKFPTKINMKHYTVEHIEKESLEKEMNEKNFKF